MAAAQFPNNALQCKVFNLRKQIDVFQKIDLHSRGPICVYSAKISHLDYVIFIQ